MTITVASNALRYYPVRIIFILIPKSFSLYYEISLDYWCILRTRLKLNIFVQNEQYLYALKYMNVQSQKYRLMPMVSSMDLA